MKSRGLVIVLAFLLAAGATAAVFLYVSGVKEEARTGGELTTVVVSKQDIATGTQLDPLIQQGAFREAGVPTDGLVAGAVTNLSQLRGQTTSAAILAGEQIPTARLSSGNLPGGALGIETGFEAVSFSLDNQQIVGGALQPGSHVTVYASFDDVQVIPGTIKQALHGTGTVTQAKRDVGDITVTVVPDTRVLRVGTGSPVPGSSSTSGSQVVILELRPEDAQNVIHSQNQGTVWLALLPPDGEGVRLPPANIIQLLLKAK